MTTGMYNSENGRMPVPKKTYQDQLMDVRGKVAHLVVTFNRERGNEDRLVELRNESLMLQEAVKGLLVNRSTDRVPLRNIDDKADELWISLKEIRRARREDRIIRDAERALALDIKNAEKQIEHKYSLKYYIYFFHKTVIVGWPDPERLPQAGASGKMPLIVRANSNEEADAIKEAKENGTGGVKEMTTQQGVKYYVMDTSAELTSSTHSDDVAESDGDQIEPYRAGTPNPGTMESDNAG